MNEQIIPFVVKRANECPFCGGKLAFINIEITTSTLDEEGHIVFDDVAQLNIIKQKIVCSRCHHTFEVITDKYNLTVKPAYDKGNVINEPEQVSDNPFLIKTKSLTIIDRT